MEPFTLLVAVNAVTKTAQSSWDVGESLYSFISSTKVVDQTVKELHLEIRKLGDACELASSQLQYLSSEYTTKSSIHDERLWKCFVDQADECDRTLAQLSRAVGNSDEVPKSFLKRARRQMQLNMSAAEIEATRSRMRTHTSGLHTILLTINIKVSNLAPRMANQELITKIGTLTDMVASLQHAQNLASTATFPGQTPITANSNLIEYAQEVVSDSTTLYEESVAGGSIADVNLPVTQHSDRLSSWLRDLDLRDDQAIVASPHPTPNTSSRPAPILPRKPVPTASRASPLPATKKGNDSIDVEDEMAAEIARASCQMGTNAMKAGEFREALDFLQEGKSLLQAVPSHQRAQVVYLWGLQFQMAVCTFHTKSPQQAVDALLEVTQRDAKDDTERVSICTASHLISQAYVKLGKLELARQACEQALNGRRTLLGRKHNLYRKSIALMARICELQGNTVRSRVYLDMIDPAVRTQIADEFSGLRPENHD